MQELRTKRIYDDRSEEDGFRVFVDRLWPRGLKREDMKIDIWLKDIAPSTELRKRYYADRESGLEEAFKLFTKDYNRELEHSEVVEELRTIVKREKVVTVLTAAKDIEHSHIPCILSQYR